MKEIGEKEINDLLTQINEFHSHPTWTEVKRDKWNKIEASCYGFHHHVFSGTWTTYGISQKGEVTTYTPTPHSPLSKSGVRKKCLLVCIGHSGRSTRYYIGLPIKS
jgi:hypothetical protein